MKELKCLIKLLISNSFKYSILIVIKNYPKFMALSIKWPILCLFRMMVNSFICLLFIELEKCYNELEVETRESIKIYHLIAALIQCNVDAS